MLKYEFKDRSANSGLTTAEEAGLKVVLYRTGYSEFNVTHVTLSSEQTHYSCEFASVAIAIVLDGQATSIFEIDGQSHTLPMEEKTAYLLLPETRFTI